MLHVVEGALDPKQIKEVINVRHIYFVGDAAQVIGRDYLVEIS
jgi:hypothetical protein